MTRATLAAEVLCISAFGWFLPTAPPPAAVSRAHSAARITAKAVWNPPPGALSEIRRKCTEGNPAQHEACFLDAMKSAGASDEAMAFVKEFADHGLAYIRSFWDTGRVDIAFI